MAFIANRLRFSRSDPVVHPKDLNPLFPKPAIQKSQPTAKDRMDGFFARNPGVPVQRMKQNPDGSWMRLEDHNG